ncbi:hypothetical protein CEXT_289021 [Caerostris extrusa]|uniref:Sleeping Beauty transposase HTH domain-containing protein n=1 Tax=Caerostris extrusa TaxID=172846 RepID=A0AAV4XW68_CAEEX|nr:hypothetical protein CEXT_289021 [Caerostris extrusa]
MPRSSELSGFEKGIIIGYHKCGRSLRDISSDLKYPKSTVAYVIKKWKVSGDCRNVPESEDQRNWEIETDECSPEKFGRTTPNQWPSSVRSFNRHPGVLFQ